MAAVTCLGFAAYLVVALWFANQHLTAAARTARRAKSLQQGVNSLADFRAELHSWSMSANDFLIRGDTEMAQDDAAIERVESVFMEAESALRRVAILSEVQGRFTSLKALASKLFAMDMQSSDAMRASVMADFGGRVDLLARDLHHAARAHYEPEFAALRISEVERERALVYMQTAVGIAFGIPLVILLVMIFRLRRNEDALQRIVHKSRRLLGLGPVHSGSDGGHRDGAKIATEIESMTDELREVQNRLVTATEQDTVTAMATTVRHELNNPLQGAMLVADLLRRDIHSNDAEAIEELDMLRAELQRIADTIQRLTEPHQGACEPQDGARGVAQS